MNSQKYLNFLESLDKQKNKIIYAKITALTLDELPLQQIEGYVTQGNINVDGASAVRRTCSLTIVAREDQFKFYDYNWSFRTKFKLEIGVQNDIESRYPDIVWFKQGIFLITSFSISCSTNNLTINIQGKDKMCLLNGEVGGNFEYGVTLGTVNDIDKKGQTIIKKIPIIDIIKNLLIHYGQEKEHNIILNDFDTTGLELLEYIGSEPLYLLRQNEATKINNDNIYTTGSLDSFLTVTTQGDTPCLVRPPKNLKKTLNFDIGQPALLKNLDKNIWGTTYDSISEGLIRKSDNIAEVWFDTNQEDYDNIDNTYNIVKIKYGQTVGFRATDLVFAGDLQAQVGESITSILDKIKNMLGDYEYFYDVDGRFIFQQKPSVYRKNWASSKIINNDLDNENKDEDYINQDETYLEKLEQQKSYVYNLHGSELITAFNNTPNIGNIKNDFSIWGSRPSASNGTTSIHLRCAIDNKPLSYTTIFVNKSEVKNYNLKYNTNLSGQRSITFIAGEKASIKNNNGRMEVTCDWREIIYRMANDYLKYGFLKDFKDRIIQANQDLYPQGITGYEAYYTDIQGFWRELYNPNYLLFNNTTLYENMYKNFYEDEQYKPYEETKEGILYQKDNYFLMEENNSNFHYNCWNKSVVEAPETINFWFDFIDSQGIINKYSIDSIGRRSKAVNDTNIKSIFYEDTPTIIFVNDIKQHTNLSSGDYSYVQVPDEINLFSISARGQSAMDKLDSLLYQHTYCTENVSITLLPIYYLEPNTRIHIEDDILGINGDYIINKFSIQLSHAGTMSITASKAIDNV